MEKLKNLNINIVLVSAVALIIGLIGYNNDSSKRNTVINVDGTCTRVVAKDKFAISVSIKNVAPNSAAAVNKSLNTYKLISNKLKVLQSATKDSLIIGTSDYSIYDKNEYNHKTGKEIKLGVESSIGLTITTKNNEALISVLELLKDYKDVYTSDFSNIVSNSTLKSVKEECLSEAINDAQTKAEKIAKALNKKLGKIIRFYENKYDMDYKFAQSNIANYRSMRSGLLEEKATSDSASIFSGSSNINVSVSVSFELL